MKKEWTAIDDFNGLPQFKDVYEIKCKNGNIYTGRWNELAFWFRCPTKDMGVLRIEPDEITHLRMIKEDEPIKLTKITLNPNT